MLQTSHLQAHVQPPMHPWTSYQGTDSAQSEQEHHPRSIDSTILFRLSGICMYGTTLSMERYSFDDTTYIVEIQII